MKKPNMDRVLRESCNKIYVPRMLIIQNLRLGVMNRLLQALCVSYAAYSVYYALYTPFHPRGEGHPPLFVLHLMIFRCRGSPHYFALAVYIDDDYYHGMMLHDITIRESGILVV